MFPDQTDDQRGSAFSLDGYGNVGKQIEDLAGIQTGNPQAIGTLNSNQALNQARTGSVSSLGDYNRLLDTEGYKNAIANANKTQAQGLSYRAPFENTANNLELASRIDSAANLDPQKIALAKIQLKGQSEREPSNQELQNYMQQTSQVEAKTGRSNALFSDVLAGGKLSMSNLAAAAQQNQMRNELWDSAHPTPGMPLYRTPEGGLGINPAGVTKEGQAVGGLGSMLRIMNGENVPGTVKIGGGLNIIPTGGTKPNITPPLSNIAPQKTSGDVENSWNNFRSNQSNTAKIGAVKDFIAGKKLTPEQRSLFTLEEWHELMPKAK